MVFPVAQPENIRLYPLFREPIELNRVVTLQLHDRADRRRSRLVEEFFWANSIHFSSYTHVSPDLSNSTLSEYIPVTLKPFIQSP
jgi:hypothetical protein